MSFLQDNIAAVGILETVRVLKPAVYESILSTPTRQPTRGMQSIPGCLEPEYREEVTARRLPSTYLGPFSDGSWLRVSIGITSRRVDVYETWVAFDPTNCAGTEACPHGGEYHDADCPQDWDCECEGCECPRCVYGTGWCIIHELYH